MACRGSTCAVWCKAVPSLTDNVAEEDADLLVRLRGGLLALQQRGSHLRAESHRLLAPLVRLLCALGVRCCALRATLRGASQ